MKVAIFGTGYVGCVAAACLARDGHQVLGVDIHQAKVDALNHGQPPIKEKGLDVLIPAQVAAGRLRATTSVADAVLATEIGMVTVGTPSASDGSVSAHEVERVVYSIGKALRQSARPYTLVVRSTLLPGILEDVLLPVLLETSQRQIGPQLQVCNHPEFLREGSAIADYDDPAFIVVGTLGRWDAQPVFDLYQNVKARHVLTDTRSAALLKYTCNAFHALKVAFANEIGVLARSFGIDGAKVMELLCLDERLNISPAYLRPGFAFGGSCLPKDLRAMTRHAEDAAINLKLMRAILTSNQMHIQRAVQEVERSQQKNIGLWGLTFKAGTDDLRESPFVTFAEELLRREYNVKIYDPMLNLQTLHGKNRAYVDQHLPHLSALLVDRWQDLVQHAGLLVLGQSGVEATEWKSAFHGPVLDLTRDLVRPTPDSMPVRAAA